MLYDASQINIAAYVRCSHEEQKLYGYTIDAQKEALQAWANENGMKIVEWYVDEGISARKKVKNRPDLQRMINDAETGKFDKIVFTKLDRYFRSVAEYHDTQKRLENARVDWQAIHEDYDSSTTDGRFKINLYLTLAEQEADRTADRIKKVFEYKVKHGQPLSGKQPVGLMIREIDGMKRVVIDETKRHIVEDAFAHFETYNSIHAVLRHINLKHGKAIEYKEMKTLLKEEKYSGHFRGNPAYCEAIIDRERWERVQTMLKRNIKKNVVGNVFLFTGLVRCESCGRVMIGRSQLNKYGKRYWYYTCKRAQIDRVCTHMRAVNEQRIEERLLATLEDELRNYILSASVEENTECADQIAKEKAAINRRLKKLKHLYIEDMIEFDEYELEYKQLKKQLEAIVPPEKADLTAARKFLENIDVLEMYPTFTREEKQALWRSIIRRIDCNDANETRPIFL